MWSLNPSKTAPVVMGCNDGKKGKSQTSKFKKSDIGVTQLPVSSTKSTSDVLVDKSQAISSKISKATLASPKDEKKKKNRG